MTGDFRSQPKAEKAPLWVRWTVGVLVIGAALSVPALAFSAWYFQNPDLLFWIAVPIILFMAG